MPICNTTISYPADLIEILLERDELRFDEVRERGSPIVKRYWTNEKYQNFSFDINMKSGKVMMKGSWAKFHNEGAHNYSRYTLADFVTDIWSLSERFGYDFSQGWLHGLEAGVNLELSSMPQPYFSPEYLIPLFVAYQGRLPFIEMRTIRGAGLGVECSLTNYRLKVYDKGTQYHRPEPILRIEYDCHHMRELQSLGIRRLLDLTEPAKLAGLGAKLHQLVKDCVVVEPLYGVNVTAAEQKLYNQADNPRFWRDLSSRRRSYYRARFQDLMRTYSPYRLHDFLCELVAKEWQELTDDCQIFLPVNCGKSYNELAQDGLLHLANI